MKLKIVAASVALVVMAGTAMADGNVKKGFKKFKSSCKSCHLIGEGADKKKQRTGPHLNGIVGRVMGSVEGPKYSKAMKAKMAAGETWDLEKLDSYLQNPSKFLGGKSKMTYKLKKEKHRVNVLAYLASLGADGKAK